MEIQSLSVVIPTKTCINNCPFCVSKMHDKYSNLPIFDESNIKKRLKYAQINNVTSLILTGTGEPLQNKTYLKSILQVLKELNHPFPNVENSNNWCFFK